MNISDIGHGMPVYVRAPDEAIGRPVGSVDHLDGEKYIKLRRSDAADSKHHWIPITWVDTIRNESLFLNKTDQEFRKGLLNQLPIEEQRLVG